MRISAKTIERLTELITGNSEKSPYRTGSKAQARSMQAPVKESPAW